MAGIEVKQAVRVAKQHVADLFAEEGVKDVGLEEIEHDDAREAWRVTIGFRRLWDMDPSSISAVAFPGKRSYKVVTLRDSDGAVLSVKLRELLE